MMKPIQRVIMVDNDPVSHLVCKSNLFHITDKIEFVEFILPEAGIEYIRNGYVNPIIKCPTVLLLDINMPVMNGWQFLEKYDGLANTIKEQITVFLLSSSVDLRDRQKAAENKYIQGFLLKPFKKAILAEVLETCPVFTKAVGIQSARYF